MPRNRDPSCSVEALGPGLGANFCLGAGHVVNSTEQTDRLALVVDKAETVCLDVDDVPPEGIPSSMLLYRHLSDASKSGVILRSGTARPVRRMLR